MRKLLNKLHWTFDYYILYMMYNEKKLNRYHEYMKQKWGNNGY